MNIFIVDKDPIIAARMLCDKHVVKMVLESSQILCTISNDFYDNLPYKPTHKNHPCVLWAKETRQNYIWLLNHCKGLMNEYTIRYKKTHKSQIDLFEKNNVKILGTIHHLKDDKLTNFVQAMPEQYKNEDTILAYRTYYIEEKSKFAKWKYTNPPEWFKKKLKIN